jgi:hypothetical protein
MNSKRATKSGRAIGRPRRIFDRGKVIRLREAGLSIPQVAREMGLSVGTVARVLKVSDPRGRPFQNPKSGPRHFRPDQNDLVVTVGAFQNHLFFSCPKVTHRNGAEHYRP